MGFEDFRLGVTSEDSRLQERVSGLNGIAPDDENHQPYPNTRYFVSKGANRYIEMQVRPRWMSIRVALCHPRSIVADLRDLIMSLAPLAEVRIEEDLPEGVLGTFTPAQFDLLYENMTKAFDASKRLWVAAYGNEEAALSCAAAIRRFV